jgi:hypothetical protein
MSYTYYATELALKLFMTAEKFMVFHTALFTLVSVGPFAPLIQA